MIDFFEKFTLFLSYLFIRNGKGLHLREHLINFFFHRKMVRILISRIFFENLFQNLAKKALYLSNFYPRKVA